MDGMKREKVIEDLTWATEEKDVWDALYGNDLEGVIDTMKAAITLLKAQEPVEPILKRVGWNKYHNDYVCPVCDEELVCEQNYCSECGRAVKWK